MNTYLVAHYGKMVPTFSQVKTLDEARSYTTALLNSRTCGPDDIISVVNVADDAIVYYGKRDELMAAFNIITNPATAPVSSWSFSLKPILNWIGMKLVGPSVG